MCWKDKAQSANSVEAAEGRPANTVRVPLILGLIVAAGPGALFVAGRLGDQPLLIFAAKLLLLIEISVALLAWGCSRLFGAARARTAMANLALLLVSLLVAAVLGEFATRIALREITTTGDNSSYFARRWAAEHVRLNSSGFREREFNLVRPNGVYRIAIVGDSFTFGQGIEESERFGNRVAEALIGTGADVEVLTFARAGADTGDEVEILKKTVLPLRPDYVLLQWFINDFEMSSHIGRPVSLPLVPSSTLEPLLHKSSAIYYVVKNRWLALQNWFGVGGSYEDYMRGRFADASSLDSRAEILALTEFLDACRANNIPVGIVLFPDLSEINEETYAFGYLHDRLIKK